MVDIRRVVQGHAYGEDPSLATDHGLEEARSGFRIPPSVDITPPLAECGDRFAARGVDRALDGRGPTVARIA